ncbi:N(6)-adenine-specific methyltransferase METTL4 [Hypomesus transpacificus]|uniref:N(6)-adenine-specific methyltransferase METTL4 n=1 Tax=Hypomesus transpacificus TaxID=137520 RepID=UPI001F074504|nr:N(6)-adenine-specific methyltransferase METTL4 [Hypomesus transpacificus]
MSIVFENDKGWLLDACSLIDQGHARCISQSKADRQRYFKCRFKQQCFQILKCHFNMNPGNTDLQKTLDNVSKAENETTSRVPSKKRKRKRSDLNQGEIDSLSYHVKVRPFIAEGTKSLVDAGLSCGYLNGEMGPQGPHPFQECNLAALCDLAKVLPLVSDPDKDTQQVQFVDSEDDSAAQVDLFTRVTENRMDCAMEVTLMREKYIIPPQCSFLLSDFTRMQPLVDREQTYELIVLDPPWENKSVKRSRRYSFLPSTQLKRLPVPSLASPGCLVVTWVTNRPSHLRFVREELYPHWGVKVLAEWLWVKVTRSGEFVFPLDSQHKRPYEVLVLGRYHGNSTESPSPSKTSKIPVEDQRVIVSVPSVLHSQKPSLSEVLKPFVGADASCLELFARSLLPGWACWGNEVLKFQHVNYFNIEATEEPIEQHAETSTEYPVEKPPEASTDESIEQPADTETPSSYSSHTGLRN